MEKKYRLTINACHFGYFVQSSVVNFLPLLFVYFNLESNMPLYMLSIMVTYNFGLQILIDLFSAEIVLKLGYRRTAILCNVFALLGFLMLGLSAYIFNDYISFFIGVMVALTFMALGGGVLEVIFSPLVEALPLKNKANRMNFLHSFYCIGHILVVVLATVFFKIFGIQNWAIFSFILMLFPITTIILFASCPIVAPQGDEKPTKRLRLFKNATFVMLFIIIVCAGAMEQAVAQWISYFAEEGLSVSKSLGDILGGCFFAFCMLLSRLYFGTSNKKFNLLKIITIFSLILMCSFILSAITNIKIVALIVLALSGFFIGIMWPSVYAIAGEMFKTGGTVMFSMLALGGDLGCTLAPAIVGMVAEFTNIRIGILSTIIFSVVAFVVGIVLLKKNAKLSLQ